LFHISIFRRKKVIDDVEPSTGICGCAGFHPVGERQGAWRDWLRQETASGP
jgi:hypothetical protein